MERRQYSRFWSCLRRWAEELRDTVSGWTCATLYTPRLLHAEPPRLNDDKQIFFSSVAFEVYKFFFFFFRFLASHSFICKIMFIVYCIYLCGSGISRVLEYYIIFLEKIENNCLLNNYLNNHSISQKYVSSLLLSSSFTRLHVTSRNFVAYFKLAWYGWEFLWNRRFLLLSTSIVSWGYFQII